MGLREEGPAQGKERKPGLPGLDRFSIFLSFFFFQTQTQTY
jgi:hypothetical protein